MILPNRFLLLLPAGFEASRHLALHGCHVIIATHRQRPDGTVPAVEVDGPG
jgi:hypothetical protein